MRSPEHKNDPRTGRRFEEELSLKYLSPGAFTVLSPQDYGVNPDPPSAPAPYRLTPNSSRRKIQAFSIIAEASSNPGSRSPSPSGRVSPFRGRGFNPAGSRHASPNPSPPRDDSRQSSASRTSLESIRSPKRSQIPQLKSRGSTGNIFGEKVTQDVVKTRNKTRSKLSPQLSQSLTNISSRYALSRPIRRKPAFEQLSPIAGSSPETGSIGNKSQSSPSKIPLSHRSQPSSRRSSPSRGKSPYNNQVSRHNSRGGSRNVSRNNSRDTSPSKGFSRIPIPGASYKEVQPKVNTFNKSKPKVPPKPDELKNGTGSKSKLVKKSSEAKLKTNKSGINGNEKESTESSDIKDVKSSGSNQSGGSKKSDKTRNNSGKTNSNQGNSNSTKSKTNSNAKLKKEDEIMVMEEEDDEETTETPTKPELQTRESSTKLVDIPTAAVVSSTTTTALQPLQIEEDLENMLKEELSKVSGYTNDGRILSATSVSSAMNKMNDTVLNSQTLLRDHNFPKLSPAASAIISLSNDNKALDTKSATTALPTIESIHKKIDGVGQNINNTFADSNKVYMESIDSSVKNNMSKAITPDHVNAFAQKAPHEKILDGRTLVPPDVKPIKILVKEKPSDIEVQSGNIRLPSSATNGVNSSPSLPPSQPETHESDHEEEETTAKKNCCLRLFSRCKCKKPTCKKWKKKKTDPSTPIKKAKSSVSCFSCRKRKSELDKGSTSTARVGEEADEKRGCWERLKCCKSKKVGDTGWRSKGNKKDNWVEKRDSVTQENVQSKISCKDKCRNALKAIFCCGMCCRKKKKIDVDSAVRRESMISKKKSLTPQAFPPPDTRPKIDISLVEHTSLMRGAIPVLPVSVAWFCLICNIFLPGVGTLLSGMFCLCLGKPRFSQNDGPKPRIGAFIIDFIIGCGQLFTVLFCLVGWGWSIWWGVIMLKVARKHKRIRLVEERAQAQPPTVNHNSRDLERGS